MRLAIAAFTAAYGSTAEYNKQARCQRDCCSSVLENVRVVRAEPNKLLTFAYFLERGVLLFKVLCNNTDGFIVLTTNVRQDLPTGVYFAETIPVAPHATIFVIRSNN